METKQYLCGIAAALLLASGACSTDRIPDPKRTEPQHPTTTVRGEVLVKFAPYVSDILDRTAAQTRSGGAATRSGVLSVDEVLDLVDGYEIERVFPVDKQNEERTRDAGLHLWYLVRFSGDCTPQQVAERLSQLGEVQKVSPNHAIRRAYDPRKRAIPMTREALGAMQRKTRAAAGSYPYDDELLPLQWHLINRGGDEFEQYLGADSDPSLSQPGSKFIVGADVQCETAWETATGDPSIVVAVLDEGVCLTHPDLENNLWVNEGEIYRSDRDNDGNGYKGDLHGYNFVSDTGVISWDDVNDSGHGSHVAGVIAARNDNGIGIGSIAGGTEQNPGVRIMSCQIFSGSEGGNSLTTVKAIKYAADNGAVVLQCSWGYTSGTANGYDWVPAFATQEEWETNCPLEKEALDYFIHNAGSPNGPIEGGVAIFAGGNESAPSAGFPGGADFCIAVAATAADYTPATYSNYADFIDISAPGGDQDYYWDYSDAEHAYGEVGCVLSTLPYQISETGYGYMEGTSMACPHVSGVAALGLSYAMQLRRHFTAEEFRRMICESVVPIDSYMSGQKFYYRYVAEVGLNQPMQLKLSNYKNRMGSGQISATKLLDAVAGAGSTLRFPNLYIAPGGQVTAIPANYFVGGELLTYTLSIADPSVATYTLEGAKLTVQGLKEGTTEASITASDGQTHRFIVTVRRGANGNGWL